jgi:archaellum biogenesis ATPase FlaH
MRFDPDKVRQAVTLLHGDELFELRYVAGKKVYSGYFKGADKLLTELEMLPDNGGNVYITLQDINDSCYNREQHDRILFGKTTTTDGDISGYSHLLIDLDPVRPAGIGSTDAQLAAAHDTAATVYKYLQGEGFPEPIASMSGNGWHLLYKLSLDRTDENARLIHSCLDALDMMFSSGAVKVDTSVFNPSRVCKLYGTYACKGADTAETPHRLSEIRTAPDTPQNVPKALLQRLAANAPVKSTPPSGQRTRGAFDLQTWLTEHNVPVRDKVVSGGTVKYILDCCPFNSDHRNKDAAVFEQADGSVGFKCFHASCADKHWREFRLHYEPDAYNVPEPDTSIKPNHMSAKTSAGTALWQRAITLADTAKGDEPKFFTLPDILAQPSGPEEYIKTGITELDSSLGGFKKTLVTCVSGLRGSGKSSLLSQIVLHACLKENARCLMFSGELTARTAADWLFRQAAGINGVRKISKFDTKYFVPDDIKRIIADKLADRLYIYNNRYGNDYTQVLTEMGRINEEKQVDMILLDNLMALDIRQAATRPEDKLEAQSRFVEQLETFAKLTNTHIVFVAHPRKAQGFLRLDDISGSGDITNRVDNAIIIHRRNADFERLTRQAFGWKKDHPLYRDGIGNVLEVCKDRENGTQDKFIPLYFEPSTKRLKNTEYENTDYFDGAFGEPF